MKNKIIIIITTILVLFGLLMIYTSSNVIAEYKFNNPYKFFIHQGIFAFIGFVLMYVLSKIDYHVYYEKCNLFLLITVILLILVLIPGIGIVRNGSRSWFGIGPFGIQPSEIAKISLIIFTSKYLANNNYSMTDIIKTVLPLFMVIIFVFLLILLEPNFGTGSIIVLTLVVLIFTSKIKPSFFLYSGLIALAGIVFLILLAPYRLKRITSFLNPWEDPLGSGFQIIQSMYAIAPGGIFGVGLGNSIQKHFYLPEPQTDFIFAIITEELGIIGVILISSLYIILFAKVIKVSFNSKDLFGRYLSLGLILELILQTLLNLLVVVGLIPVTGVTLPFISYGGSSLLISMASIGIIQSIEYYKNYR